MTRKTLTIGAKLFTSLGAVLFLVLALLAVFLLQGRTDSFRLRDVMQIQNRKLDIAAQVELATTEMQGAQRGLMLAFAMNDPAASGQYKQVYADSGRKIDSLVLQMQPLLETPSEKRDMERIRESRSVWEPRFQTLVDLCEAGRIADAYKLRNENKVISAQMHAVASDLAAEQKNRLAESWTASEGEIAKAKWLAALFVCLSAALCAVVFKVVRDVTRTLRRVAAELHRGAGQVASAAAQVSSSSQLVAGGTSEQAAAIEETSTSAALIRAMTEKNAARSHEAAEVMGRTSVVIDDTNRYLDTMHSSMQQINASCEQVGKIVKVIDSIAFQTNILALNAAVESARAGEAGQGFAVVAEEVRNLARRSTEAARETAELIDKCIVRSRNGRADLDQVASSIRKLTDSANQISTFVTEVSLGTGEQAQGIRQIASALSQMEQGTQAAAATAEETAAVGQEMNAQADSLHFIVGGLLALVGEENRPGILIVANQPDANRRPMPAFLPWRQARVR